MQNPIITVIYSHGRLGSPWHGCKIEVMRPIALKLGMNMASIRYPEDLTVEGMEQKLLNLLKDDVNVPGDLVFLSSSRGAYISTRVSAEIAKFYAEEPVRSDGDKVLARRNILGQFLIAPAFYIKPEYFPDQDPRPADMMTTIVHGYDDAVVSFEHSIRFARKFKAQLHLIEGDHRMNSQRDQLCVLFESFLKNCRAKSDEILRGGV